MNQVVTARQDPTTNEANVYVDGFKVDKADPKYNEYVSEALKAQREATRQQIEQLQQGRNVLLEGDVKLLTS